MGIWEINATADGGADEDDSLFFVWLVAKSSPLSLFRGPEKAPDLKMLTPFNLVAHLPPG